MPKDYALEDLAALEEKQRKAERRIMTGVILALGVGGILLSWHFAFAYGFYSRFLAFFSPILIIGAIYSAIFPNDFSNPSRKKLSFRMWVAIIVGLLSGFAHILVFEFGLF